jgi:hypothetical protein
MLNVLMHAMYLHWQCMFILSIAKFDLYANFVTSFLIEKVCLGRALPFTELVEVLTRLKRRIEGDRKEERERGTER